jgi:hypothetical protein
MDAEARFRELFDATYPAVAATIDRTMPRGSTKVAVNAFSDMSDPSCDG